MPGVFGRESPIKGMGGGKGRSVLVMAEGLWGIGNIGVLKKYRY